MVRPGRERCASLRGRGRVSLRPPAKINISLVVFQRREDGYHELHTVMGMIDLCDRLDIEGSETPGIQLECGGIASPGGPDNLVYRAAEMLAHEHHIEPALKIRLNKEIPVGAGLGGASSDAASCLIGLNRFWKLDLSTEELSQHAARLGSDVAFFLYGPVAQCTGRGETVQPLPVRCHRELLLIIPNIHVSTAYVYKNHSYQERRETERMDRVRHYLRDGNLDGLLQEGINSLTPTCLRLFEPLAILRDRLEELGIGPVHMSGSGSCLFASSDSKEQSAQWAATIEAHKLADVRMVQFLNHAEPFLEVHHADI